MEETDRKALKSDNSFQIMIRTLSNYLGQM